MIKKISDDKLNYFLGRLNVASNGKFSIEYADDGVRLMANNGLTYISDKLTKRELYNHLVVAVDILAWVWMGRDY
jgi:hypothetical protein